MSSTLFVSGASGQLGRAVVEQLLARGARVIAGTRSPDKLADLVERGADIRRIDFTDPATVQEAFSGVGRALIISTDAVGNRAGPQVAAVAAAARAGVKHLVYTSVVSADQPGMALADEHSATEEAIRTHFDSYTILRNNLYAELLFQAIGPAVAMGQLVTARADGRVSWVSRQDCAKAAAAALTDDFDGPRVLEIAGPDALSGDETARIFSEVSGRPIQHIAVPGPALQQGLEGAGVPAPFAGMLVAFDLSASRGLLDKAPTDFQALTGEAGISVQTLLESQRDAWASQS